MNLKLILGSILLIKSIYGMLKVKSYDVLSKYITFRTERSEIFTKLYKKFSKLKKDDINTILIHNKSKWILNDMTSDKILVDILIIVIDICDKALEDDSIIYVEKFNIVKNLKRDLIEYRSMLKIEIIQTLDKIIYNIQMIEDQIIIIYNLLDSLFDSFIRYSEIWLQKLYSWVKKLDTNLLNTEYGLYTNIKNDDDQVCHRQIGTIYRFIGEEINEDKEILNHETFFLMINHDIHKITIYIFVLGVYESMIDKLKKNLKTEVNVREYDIDAYIKHIPKSIIFFDLSQGYLDEITKISNQYKTNGIKIMMRTHNREELLRVFYKISIIFPTKKSDDIIVVIYRLYNKLLHKIKEYISATISIEKNIIGDEYLIKKIPRIYIYTKKSDFGTI